MNTFAPLLVIVGLLVVVFGIGMLIHEARRRDDDDDAGSASGDPDADRELVAA